MVNGTPQERALLANIFQFEHALLFAAFWWHLATRGYIGIVLPRATINYLIRILGDIPLDTEREDGPRGQTTFPIVARRMREVRAAAQQYANTMTTQGFDNLSSYEMVWTDDYGFVDIERPGARRMFRNRRGIRE